MDSTQSPEIRVTDAAGQVYALQVVSPTVRRWWRLTENRYYRTLAPEDMWPLLDALAQMRRRLGHLWDIMPFDQRMRWGGDLDEACEGLDHAISGSSEGQRGA